MISALFMIRLKCIIRLGYEEFAVVLQKSPLQIKGEMYNRLNV